MFRFFRILSAVILCQLVISSCQKEVSVDTQGTPGNSSGVNGTFKAKIDGVQYTADAVVTASVILGGTTISASSKDKKTFAIAITDTAGGTYILDQNSLHGIAFVDSTDSNLGGFASNEGADTTQSGGKITITFDRVKKIISGTFTCKLMRGSDKKQKVVTEGTFQIPYSNTIPLAKATDTLRVKIDGKDWTAKSITANAGSGLLTIIASEQNLTKIVTLQFPQLTTNGTYDFDFAGNYVGLYLPDGLSPYTADSGMLTVVEHKISSKRIRANFNFKASALAGGNSAVFTNGYFSVGY